MAVPFNEESMDPMMHLLIDPTMDPCMVPPWIQRRIHNGTMHGSIDEYMDLRSIDEYMDLMMHLLMDPTMDP